MDAGGSTVVQGQNAVVSNLKDIFNKRFAQKENESSGGPNVCESISPEKVLLPVTNSDVAEKIKKADLPVVLITNDDGITAPGLQALVSALVEGDRCNVYVCAPDSDQSATSHSVTYRENLSAESVDISGATAFQVSGTPADCVSLTLSGAFCWPRPALVISGINKGANTGLHIIYSGTVAGAREAFIFGIPALAISLNWESGESKQSDFKIAAEVVLPLIYAALRDIKLGTHPKDCFYNVSIPVHPAQNKGYKVAKQGTSHMILSWKSVSAYKRASMAKDTAIGVQLAQLGLAASAAGARRQTSLARSVPVEIESTGAAIAAPNGTGHSSTSQRLLFRMQTSESEIGESSDDHDYGALQQGFITVTPLGLLTNIEPELEATCTSWISSAAEVPVPSCL